MMNLLRFSALLRIFLLVRDASTMVVLVSSYTFDPLNNSWKPSANRKNINRSHHSSSSASSYSYAPAEPIPSVGVQFTYNEQDIVRHHYTAWVFGDNEKEDSNDPAFVPKQTLVEIQYNKKTGEVSLLDEDGVVTPEEYKRLMKAVKYSNERNGDSDFGTTASQQRLQSQEREEDVAVGSTLFVDPEDLDPIDIIDTEGHDISIEDHAHSSPEAYPPMRSSESQHYPQQLRDDPDISMDYQPDAVSSLVSDDSIDSCSIPAPTRERNYPIPQYQHHRYSQESFHATSAVAGPTLDFHYQKEKSHQQHYTECYTTAVAEQLSTLTNDEIMEEGYEDEATNRSRRGFGFANRREFFYGSN